ncbi:MAG: extracellular solute-binding protein [Lachnospiraceae bacterium]|nr:extracellular solute-binding protein [Lachnospiraceae bacterium]MDD3796309.1 extracellular solute-binding protein [Lachnospiraceae bacterium]
MKRKTTLFCTTALAAALAAGGMTAYAEGTSELTIFWGSEESTEYTDYMNQVISEFEAANPDIKINLFLVSDPEGQAKQQMAAGGGPDLINIDSTSMHIFASSDYLVPLDSYAQQYNWSSRFDQWVVDSLSYDGQWYGLPGMMDGMVVYYNDDLFQENGWKIPESYDELVSLCQQMTEKNILPFAYGTSDYKQANQWWISQAFCAGMGQEDLHKLLQGELEWTSDEVRNTVDQLVNLWKNNYIYKDSAAITMDEARSLFTTGKAGMYMSGTWEAAPLDEANPDFTWKVYQMPSWRDGVDSVLPVALGGSFSINAKCENPDAAAKFLDYMYQPEVAARMLAFGTLYPEKDIDISAIDAPENVKMLQNFVDDSLETGKVGYCAWSYWPANTDTYAWNTIESICLDQISVDEYLTSLQENFQLDQEKGNVLTF